jgi:hypothetical protein
MKYPKEVADRVSILDEYQENPKLNCFNIVHLYPMGLAYPDGYYDAQFFTCVIFNTKTMEKRTLGSRFDALDFWEGCVVSKAQVYADGAYLLKFSNMLETVGIKAMLCIQPHK